MRLLLIALFFILTTPVVAAPLKWEPAPRSDDFVDSIGVCTHWNYHDVPYGTAYEKLKQRLAAAGIRNMRDGADPHELELWRDLGIRTTVLAEPQSRPLDQQMALWKSNPRMYAMIEGPNEPNLFWPRFNVHYKGETWPRAVQLWQSDLYKAVRAEPLLNHVPVTSPTPIFEGPFQVAPVTSFDYLALHPYAGGNMPSASIPWVGQTLRTAFAMLGHDADLKPLVATECGYHYALGSGRVLAGVQGGISETAGGRYFPRLFAEFWNAGFVHTFTYELVDEHLNADDPEANFGMLRNDTSPKPAYTAVANMISILTESHWNPRTLQWPRAAAPARAFKFAIDGPADIHHTTLSRANGTIDLLLWREVPSFDLKTKRDLFPAPAPVTVRLAAPAVAVLYHPLAGTGIQRRWPAARSISLSVPDEVVILRIAAKPPAGAPPAAPAKLTAVTSAMSATLHWQSRGNIPAAYVVSRLGRYLAAVTPERDGTASFTDDALIPGLGFSYSIRAVGKNGLLSTPAQITASTSNERPDLVVKSLTWEPLHPKAGDEVRFTVTLANVGAAPSPAVTHGVAIAVDGKTVCWSDTFHDSLAPGAQRVLSTNAGPAGKGTWTCAAAGTFQITAIADDVNRIDESDKQNNTLSAVLTADP